MPNLFDMKAGKAFAVLHKIAEMLTPEDGESILAMDSADLNILLRCLRDSLNAMEADRRARMSGIGRRRPVRFGIEARHEPSAISGDAPRMTIRLPENFVPTKTK